MKLGTVTSILATNNGSYSLTHLQDIGLGNAGWDNYDYAPDI